MESETWTHWIRNQDGAEAKARSEILQFSCFVLLDGFVFLFTQVLQKFNMHTARYSENKKVYKGHFPTTWK